MSGDVFKEIGDAILGMDPAVLSQRVEALKRGCLDMQRQVNQQFASVLKRLDDIEAKLNELSDS